MQMPFLPKFKQVANDDEIKELVFNANHPVIRRKLELPFLRFFKFWEWKSSFHHLLLLFLLLLSSLLLLLLSSLLLLLSSLLLLSLLLSSSFTIWESNLLFYNFSRETVVDEVHHSHSNGLRQPVRPDDRSKFCTELPKFIFLLFHAKILESIWKTVCQLACGLNILIVYWE